MTTSSVPIAKWMQVNETVILLKLLAHESTHNPSNLDLVNRRAEEVLKVKFNIASSGLIMGISWMALCRMYEVINKYIVGGDRNSLKGYIASQATIQCQIESFDDLISSYGIEVIDMKGVIMAEFQQSLWKMLKLMRNAISHYDYEFDNSAGDRASDVIIRFDHSHGNVSKLKMNMSFDKFILLAEHFTIWVDSALQENNMILENA